MEKQTNGINFLEGLALLFIGLKLTDNIDWSWWWVTAPIWVAPTLVVVAIILAIFNNYLARLVNNKK